MKQPLLVATLSLGLALPLLADQPIKFSNSITDIGFGGLVTFGTPTPPNITGTGVRNNPLPVFPHSYVAALFVSNGGVLTQIGAVAPFRASTTGSPGTWTGATRTLVGVAQGTPLTLVVQAWDSAFSNMEASRAAGALYGQSAPFFFRDAMSSPAAPTDTLMVNFHGFSINNMPEPSTIVLGALGSAAVLWFSRSRR